MQQPSYGIDPATKARIAIEAVRRAASPRQIAAVHGVHPLQVLEWKRRLLAEAQRLFEPGPSNGERSKAVPSDDCESSPARILEWRSSDGRP